MLLMSSDNSISNPILKDERYYFQLKIDGDRLLFYNGRLYNRRLIPQEQNFPEIAKALKESGCWCDGEIAIGEGKDFNEFQNWRKHPERLIYYVFHIFKGKLPKHPQIKLLENYDNGFALFKYSKDMGYEGIIAKKRNYKYVPDYRTMEWLKFKNFKTEVIRVYAYELNKAGITFTYPLRVACNGKKHKAVKELFDRQGYLDIEIQYLEKTKTGKYRQPTFKRVVR